MSSNGEVKMKVKKLSVCLLLLASPLISSAENEKYERKYKVEVCEKSDKGKIGECKTLDYVLKVDYGRRNVAMNIYYKGEFGGNAVLKGCDFFDAQNWNCSDGSGNVAYANGDLRMKVVPELMTLKFTLVKQ